MSLHLALPAAPLSTRGRDLGAAAIAACIVVGATLVFGESVPTDARGDNDSLLRLVQIRDLLAGQGWFDLHQYRMGPEGGFVMHWSRLVDAPIAALMALGTAIAGAGAGEAFALAAWPGLLFAAGTFLILRAATMVGGETVRFPAFVLGAISLFGIGIFRPGTLDHHNLQLVLTLALACGLLATGWRGGLAAGAAAALMLAVGMETAPLIAAAGAAVAGLLLFRGSPEAGAAAGFGLGFAGVSAAAFVLTASSWTVVSCDAFSSAQAGPALAAGLGLAGVSAMAWRSFTVRFCALLVLALALCAGLLAAAPQCLADPYAGLDPRLRDLWLAGIGEAQTAWSMLRNAPGLFFASYATPALALVLLGRALLRGKAGRAQAVLGPLLLAAFAVSLWQVRGAIFSVPLAAILLGAWVAEWRDRASRTPALSTTLGMVLAWLASFHIVWGGAAAFAANLFEAAPEADLPAVQGDCYRGEDYRQLAGLDAGTVLVVSNLGSAVLAHTPHRVLAGPYHRNVEGNLAALDALLAPPAKARAVAADHGVRYVAVCPGNDESPYLARLAPDGLLARLLEGQVPAWLTPLPSAPDAGLTLYRVED